MKKDIWRSRGRVKEVDLRLRPKKKMKIQDPNKRIGGFDKE